MKIFDDVLNQVNRGRDGLNQGLPMGFNRLVEYIPNITQGTYFLIGGETSSGKSAFVDNCFVFNPYDFVKSNTTNIKLKIIYFSFEIEKKIKITKAIARRIFLDYGKLVDVNYILSRGKNRCNDEDYELVKSYKKYFYELEDYLEIIDKPENPTGIWHHLTEYSKTVGTWDNSEKLAHYTPHDPNLHTIVVIDHLGIIKSERGYDKKQNIDKLSEYLIILRNKCNFIPVVISQFNRTISSTDRFKLDRVTPQLSDFKDSSNTQEDCNIALSLFSPQRYEIANYRDYKITPSSGGLGDRGRFLSLLKNRDGEADKTIGLKFIGEVGHFEELPKAADMTQETYNTLANINR